MLAILLAWAAAAVYASGTSLQHRAASRVPHADVTAIGLLARLLRRPSWLLGIALSGIGFVLHVAALHRGSLTLVQPVVVSTVVFAVFVRAGLDRRLPPRKEVAWAICTWAGLFLFIGVLETRAAGHAANDRAAGLFSISGLAISVLAILWAKRTGNTARRGLLLGVAAGVLFGLTAGLLKVATTHAAFGPTSILGHWSLWAMPVAGIGALSLTQRAYQAARLSVTMPILNIADVLVAIGFGSSVFGERLFSSPARMVAELAGLIVMGIGVWQLARQEEVSGHFDYPTPTRSA
jgi:membrane-associated PAP2 superfamily phosphatase